MIYEKYIQVLYIDLTTRKIRVEKREDLMPYLGGVGIASKLLQENMKPGVDPFDPSQPIIFAIGAASTVFPVITKTVAMFISPLTGELGESYAGGRLAMMLLHAGFDAIVITGKADKPVYLSVKRKDVEFRDARAIWGLGADEIGRVIRDKDQSAGKRSIIRIGLAGEKLVNFASVTVDTYRHFGRLGLGALFGSKHLKAISIIGDRYMPIKDFKGYFKVFQDIYKRVTTTEIMGKYHDLGTPMNVESLSVSGSLPTKNLQTGTFENAADITGEQFARKNLVRKMACTGCPVGCIHIGQFRRDFNVGHHEYEAVNVGYDYELIYALGSFLGITTTDEILSLIEDVEHFGMDAMSTGVVLGWATEALAKGLITTEETLVPLEFGKVDAYEAAIAYIAERKNEFYNYMAKGAYAAAKRYGGQDFAMTIAKHEMPGYHTGYGSLLGVAVGARHSHLCNGGYSVDQTKKELTNEQMADALYKEEVERCMLNSLIICLFARKVYDRDTILSALNAIGNNYTNQDLDEIAERIYVTKLQIKQSLGFDQLSVKIPKRYFETPSGNGVLDKAKVDDILKIYIKKTQALLEKYTL